MQTVVSNSSPIIHLAKIGHLNLLNDFFGVIAIPKAVYDECVTENEDYEEIPIIRTADWLHKHSVSSQNLIRLLSSELDKGESEAIALALERRADLLLLDDAEARQTARLYGLKITGTLGILLRAKKENRLKSLRNEINQLILTGFRINRKLIEKLLTEAGESL